MHDNKHFDQYPNQYLDCLFILVFTVLSFFRISKYSLPKELLEIL